MQQQQPLQAPQETLQQPSNPDQEQSYLQETEAVYRGSRATIKYDLGDDQVDDTEDDELVLDTANELDISGDELPDISDLPLDPEQPEEDEFVEGSPRFEQFRSDFDKAFGIPLEEARDLVQGLRDDSIKRAVNEQKYELSAAWNVSVTEVEQRLAVVKTLWDKLPPDKQQAYDSPKGAQVLYARYEQDQQRRGTAKVKSSTKVSPANGGNKYWYTQAQIDRMPQDEYYKQSDRIMLAYAQGRVRR
jgi:hypothetical protein